MRTFFHGWRRMLGCLTLVMACLLMGVWMRSRVVTDQIWKDPRRNGSLMNLRRLAISGGAVYWIRQDVWWERVFMSELVDGRWIWITESDHDPGIPTGYRYTSRYWMPGAEIAVTESEDDGQKHPLDKRIFYWKCSLLWLILPLTLAAAWLIFGTSTTMRGWNSSSLKASSD